MNSFEITNSAEDSKDVKYSFYINSLASVTCLIDGKVPLKMLIDTGSSANIVDAGTWKSLKLHKIDCESCVSNEKLHPYGNITPLNVIGHFKTTVSCNEKECEAEFIVLDGKGQPLLRNVSVNECS